MDTANNQNQSKVGRWSKMLSVEPVLRPLSGAKNPTPDALAKALLGKIWKYGVTPRVDR